MSDRATGSENSKSIVSRMTGSWLPQLYSSQFVRHVGQTYATHIAKIIFGVGVSILTSRLLGPAGRGLYAVAGAIGAVGIQFANLGLHTSNVYYVARDRKLAGPLAGNALVASFGGGTVLAVCIAVFFSFKPGLLGVTGPLLYLAVAGIPIGLAYLLSVNLLLGLTDVRGFNTAELIQRSLPLIPLLVLARFAGATPFEVLIIATAAVVTSFIYVCKRLIPLLQPGVHVSRSLFQENISYGTRAYLGALFSFLVLRSDLFLVAHMRGSTEAGFYSIASTMAELISLLAVSVAVILFPKITAISDVREKLAVTWKAAGGTAALMLPLIVSSCFLAKPAIHLLYGSAFLPSFLPYVLLLPGIFFLCLESVLLQFLNSIGYPKSVVYVLGSCTVLNVVGNLFAIPRWGMCGASVVSSICYTLAFVGVASLVLFNARKHKDNFVGGKY